LATEFNQHQSGVNSRQSLHAEADHSKDSLAVTHNAEVQLLLSILVLVQLTLVAAAPHPACHAGGLTLTKAAGTGFSGEPGPETDNATEG